jgi:hypothetical protein
MTGSYGRMELAREDDDWRSVTPFFSSSLNSTDGEIDQNGGANGKRS